MALLPLRLFDTKLQETAMMYTIVHLTLPGIGSLFSPAVPKRGAQMLSRLPIEFILFTIPFAVFAIVVGVDVIKYQVTQKKFSRGR